MTCVGSDRVLRIWDAATGRPLAEVRHPAPTPGIATTAFMTGGGRVLTAGDDGTLRVWESGTGRPVGEPLTFDRPAIELQQYHPAVDAAVVFVIDKPGGPPGTPGAAVSMSGQTQTWLVGERRRWTAAADPRWVSPDSRVGVDVMHRALVDMGSGRSVGRSLREGDLVPVTFTRDSRLLVAHYRQASGNPDQVLRLYAAASGRQLGPDQLARAAVYLPDPERMVIRTGAVGRAQEDVRAIHLRALAGPGERIRRWAEWLTGKTLEEGGVVKTAGPGQGWMLLGRVMSGTPGAPGVDLPRFDDREPALPPWR